MHLVGRLLTEDWKPILDGVRSDLADKGVTEADVDTSEKLEGVIYST